MPEEPWLGPSYSRSPFVYLFLKFVYHVIPCGWDYYNVLYTGLSLMTIHYFVSCPRWQWVSSRWNSRGWLSPLKLFMAQGDHLSLIIFANLISSDMVGIFQILPFQQYHLVGYRRPTFSITTTPQWSEGFAFCKALMSHFISPLPPLHTSEAFYVFQTHPDSLLLIDCVTILLYFILTILYCFNCMSSWVYVRRAIIKIA